MASLKRMQAVSINGNTFDLQQLGFVRLATTVGPELASANWQRRREIIRTLVQRIDIDAEVIKIVFRLTQQKRTPMKSVPIDHATAEAITQQKRLFRENRPSSWRGHGRRGSDDRNSCGTAGKRDVCVCESASWA
jgi:hypothetical protein